MAKHLEIRELDKKHVSGMRAGAWLWSVGSGGKFCEGRIRK